MSKASPIQSDWFKQNYEKILLIGVLLLLLVSASILAVRIGEGRRLIEESFQEVVRSEGQDVKPVDLRQMERVASLLNEPRQVSAPESRMWASEVRVSCVRCSKPIRFEALKCPFCGADQPAIGSEIEQDTDGDGIPDEWEITHGMDPFVPDDAQFDLDGDGFAALVEFRWGTDAKDPASHPPFVAKLRFDKVVTEPFRLQFLAMQEVKAGDFMFQLNDRVRGQSFFRRLGTEVEGFTLTEFRKEEDALVLISGERRVTLIRGREIEDEFNTVRFAFLLDRSSPEARVGQSIALRGVEYRVLELLREGVRVENAETGEAHVIEGMSETERRHMAGPSGMNVQMPGFEVPGLPGMGLPLP